jgi:hypothetical protein
MRRLKDLPKLMRPPKPWYKKWWVWSLIIIFVPLTLLWMMTPYGFWSALGAMVLGLCYDRGD